MIVNMTLDQLHCNEVLVLPSVIEDQSVLVCSLQLEVDVDQVVGLHLRRPEVGVVGGEGDGLVDRVLQVLELDVPCISQSLSLTLHCTLLYLRSRFA